MQQIDAKGALAYLVTRPSRPRYQARTMHVDYVDGDADHARLDTERQAVMYSRIEALASGLAHSSAGSVPAPEGPLWAGCLLLLGLGAAAFLR